MRTMVEWYEKTKDYTNRDKQYLLLAYRNTLCKDEEGQQVLCHIKTLLEYRAGNQNATDAERVAAIELLDIIFNNCGITGNMKIVKALSGVAASFVVPKKEDEDNLNV